MEAPTAPEAKPMTLDDALMRLGSTQKPEVDRSVTDERKLRIDAKLQKKIETKHGVDWELLSLEFQRDLLILAAEFGRWGRYLDRTFASQDKSPNAG